MSASSFLALPKPDIRNGFSFCKEHLTTVLPMVLATAAGTYLICSYFGRRSCKKSRINREVNKDSPKVVHSVDMEDIGSKAVYCRCWRSRKFPYCDGTHTKHNEETGDNVGPLIIKKRDA